MVGIVAHMDVLNTLIVVGCSCGYIFGYVFGILGAFFLILIACFVIGLCFYYWKWLKKKDKVSEEESLKFGEPPNQGVCVCQQRILYVV